MILDVFCSKSGLEPLLQEHSQIGDNLGSYTQINLVFQRSIKKKWAYKALLQEYFVCP